MNTQKLNNSLKPERKHTDLNRFDPRKITLKTRPPSWINRKKIATLPEDDEDLELLEGYFEKVIAEDGDECVTEQEIPAFTDSRIKVLENPLAGRHLYSEAEDIIQGAVQSYRAESKNLTELVSAKKILNLYKGLPYFTSSLIMKVIGVNKRQAQYYMTVLSTCNLLIQKTKNSLLQSNATDIKVT
ncbi:hypothetical protein [Thiomicrorhabdus sp.]|uniref:hypothetical protein n=1 Tax=Thiomicrorhabdus sp. TaxID=2039724 RepID=UPI002AA89945|nr:hypothetical protein [Thiomicrorhabdus sp.]